MGEFVRKYYSDLYQIREPTDEFREFDSQVRNEAANLKNNRERENISKEELITVIKTIKIGKSKGPDNISNKLIKNLNPENLEKLAALLTMLFQENKVPQQWKLGTVKSIYKGKGTKGNPKNDRGITLSSNILKIMEK